MGIDHHYFQINGKWKWVDPSEEESPHCTDFWVDICHGGGFLIDDRFYFPDLSSALDFYLKGWKAIQYTDRSGKEVGVDHKGLYSRGRLIHGLSIYGEAPGHEGESLQQILDRVADELLE
jgi:hypothetical protein